MNKIKDKKIFLVSLVPFLIFFAVLTFIPAFSKGGDAERKIIVFKEGTDENEKDDLIRKHGGEKIKDLKSIRGKAIYVSREGEKRLEKEKAVLRIDDDIIIRALNNRRVNDDNEEEINKESRGKDGSVSQPSQVLPWGIDRINAELAWELTTADLIKVAVIDTGIDLKHPDLKLNIKGGVNTINPGRSSSDDNGHGTHVAGIIGAINNTIGVVGTGPQIDLYSIKALNRNGSGFLSDIIEGIDWAIERNIQVINMSLGARVDIQSFHDAVIRANNAGITVVAAAGNDFGGPVNFPAAYPEVIAVSAIDQNDQIASFSSVGQEVDFAAPGVSIFSTYKGFAYATLSGTSMASPHVAGAVALVISVPAKCDTDLNGKCSPSEVYSRLAATAEDLGVLGVDDFYGNGLIDAEKSVKQ